MRSPVVNLEGGALDDFGRKRRRGDNRDDLIVIAVKDQGRHVELLEILGKIGLREGLDAVENGLMTAQHPLEPERVPQSLRDFGARTVGAVEWRAEFFEELRAIGQHAGPKLIEYLERQADRI